MSGWQRVGEVAEQIRGVTYGKEDAFDTPEPGTVPVLRAGNIHDGQLVFDDLVYVRTERISRDQYLKEGDVLVATSSGSLDVVGKAARAPRDLAMSFGAFCKVLRPSPDIDSRYFAHWFSTPSYRRKVSSLAAGANINNLRNEHLDDLEVPAPSLGEQRRIADMLDKADAIRRKRKAAIALTDSLLRSTFLDMFGDPVTNPKGWPVVAVAALVDKVEAGWSANGEPRSRRAEEFGVLKISAVTSGLFRPSEHKAVSAIEGGRPLIHPRAGDLLFSRANTRELVAATCLVLDDEPMLFLPDKIWRVTPRQRAATAPYMKFLLSNPRVRAALASTA